MISKRHAMMGALVLAVAAAGAVGYTVWQRRAAQATAAQATPQLPRAVSNLAAAEGQPTDARGLNRVANQAIVAPGSTTATPGPIALPPAGARQLAQQGQPQPPAQTQAPASPPVQVSQAPATQPVAPVAPTLARDAQNNQPLASGNAAPSAPTLSPGATDAMAEGQAGQRSLVPTASQSPPARRTFSRVRYARPEICN